MIDLQFPKYAVKNHLRSYLGKLSAYSNFDRDMSLIVYQNANNNEFLAFESMEYNLSFLSSNCRPSELILLQQENKLNKYKLSFNKLFELLKEPIQLDLSF